LAYYYSVEGADTIDQAGVIGPNTKKEEETTRNKSIPGAEDYFALLESPNLDWYDNAITDPDCASFNTCFRQTRIEMQDGQISLDQAIEKSQNEFDSSVATD